MSHSLGTHAGSVDITKDAGPSGRSTCHLADRHVDLHTRLLVARHGKGYFVYTSLAWFRQLPEGVPGAYRLFANLVSLGQ